MNASDMTPDSEAGEWTVTLEVPPGYREAARLDVYITRSIMNASRAKVQQGILEGRVQVNGVTVERSSYRVQPGDRITCLLLRPPPAEAKPENIPLDIVYEDDYLIVVNKAAGMVVHPAYGNRDGTLVNALLYHVGGGTLTLEEEDDLEDEEVGLSIVNATPSKPGDPSIRPGIVHRLDKDTSGLMVIAKDDVTHRKLAAQFERRTIQRRYIGITWGVPDPLEGRIEAAIGRDPKNRKRMAVVPEASGKHAITHYRVNEAFAYSAVVSFKLETGRTHQIRVHARHIGHSLFGDPVYDGRTIRTGPQTSSRKAFYHNLFEVLNRQALHAFELGFIHPHIGSTLHFEVDLPEDMRLVVERLRDVEGRIG